MACYKVKFIYSFPSPLTRIGLYHLPLSNTWMVSMLQICLYVTKTYPLRFSTIFLNRRFTVKKGHGPLFPVTEVLGRRGGGSSPNESFAQQQSLHYARQVSRQEKKLGGVKFTLIRLCFHFSFAFNTQETFCPSKGLPTFSVSLGSLPNSLQSRSP